MTTLYDILEELKDVVLTAHPFFLEGYAFARQEPDKGIVMSIDRNRSFIGITDTKGNYFYIRISDKITSTPTKSSTDCSSAIRERMRCSLVAVVKDANVFALKDSLVNTLMKTGVVAIADQYIDMVAITKSEFNGLNQKVIDLAISRLKNMTLARIDFDIERTFNTNSCTYNICQC